MTKLLDFVKEKGLSHANAMELIEKHYVKPEDEEEVVNEPDTEEGEIDKPEDEVINEEEKTKALVKKLADEQEAEANKAEEAKKVKIAELVKEELKRRGKITRKTPSSGELKKKPTLEYDINVRGYEVKTIKTKK